MAAGAEADDLGRIVHLGLPLVVLALEPREIDDQGGRRGLAGQRRDLGRFLRVVDHRGLHYATGHGFTCQMPAAYSAIVRSLENLPELATFRMALCAQPFGSAYSALSLPSASRYERRSARCM